MRKVFYLLSAILFMSHGAYAQPGGRCPDINDITVTVNDTCAGMNLELIAEFSGGGTFGWRAQWAPVPPTIPYNFNPGRIAVLPNATVARSGNYEVTVYRQGCTDPADTVRITVAANIKETPTLTSVTQNSPLCYGGELILTPNGFVTGGYEWTLPDGSIASTSTNPALVVSDLDATKTGVYQTRALNTNGCYSQNTILTNVTVEDSVNAAFQFDVAYGTDCVNPDIVTVTHRGTNNSTSWIYAYTPTNGSTTTTNQGDPQNYGAQGIESLPNLSLNDANSGLPMYPGNLSVTMIVNSGQCADTFTKDTIISHPVIADFTTSADSICQGETTIEFTDNSSDAVPDQVNEYTWFFDNGDSVKSQNATYDYTIAGEYDVKLVLKDFLNCRDTATKKIFVDSTAPITIALSDYNVCIGKSIDFNVDFTRIGLTGIQWTFGDGNISFDTTLTYNYDQAGTFPIRFDAMYRICPDLFDEDVLTIKPNPIVDLGPDTSICTDGEPVRIKDWVNGGNPNASWLWNTVTADTTDSVIVRAPGVYAATVTIDGCSTTDSARVYKDCYIDVPNAFTPDGDGNNDYFLPRQLLSSSVAGYKMTIFNRWGRIIYETTSTNGRGWDGRYNGEIQPMGVYMYLIEATFANNRMEKYQGNVTLLR